MSDDGNDLHVVTATIANRNIDAEYLLESLSFIVPAQTSCLIGVNRSVRVCRPDIDDMPVM